MASQPMLGTGTLPRQGARNAPREANMAKNRASGGVNRRRGPSGSKSSSRINFGRLSARQLDHYRSALDALKLKRENPNISLTKAAKESGTTAPTVRRYVGSALIKHRGRYGARPSDRLRRDLVFYDSKGKFTLTTHSSRQSSTIAKYHNAVRAYIVYGDDSALKLFEGKAITVHGKPYAFMTDRRTLNRLARAGELHFLDIYGDGVTK
jgi:hypothetical protein